MPAITQIIPKTRDFISFFLFFHFNINMCFTYKYSFKF